MGRRMAMVVVGVVLALVGLFNGAWVTDNPYPANWGVAIFALGAVLVVFGWPRGGRTSGEK